MDLIFKRYSNPFLLLDNLIESDDLEDAVDMIINQSRNDNDWQLYLSLNPWNEKNFLEWKKEIYKSNKSNEVTMSKKEAKEYFQKEYKNSLDILNNFKPPQEERR